MLKGVIVTIGYTPILSVLVFTVNDKMEINSSIKPYFNDNSQE